MKAIALSTLLPLAVLAQAPEPASTTQALPAEPVVEEAVFEAPPVLPAEQFLSPQARLVGSDYRVRELATTDGYMATFTIDSDFGTFVCVGKEHALQCINEIAGIRTLVETSKGELFAKGLKRSIERPVAAVQQLVEEPVDTVKQLPSTVGHFFKKVGRSVGNAAAGFSDRMNERSSEGDSEQMTETMKEVGQGTWKAAKGIAGFDSAKLECARQLQVDPYSDNERLQEEMDKVAWTFFAGGLPLSLATSAAASIAITATTYTGLPDEIYRETPSELRVRNDEALAALGIEEELRVSYDNSPLISTSLKRSIVLSLAKLGVREGLADVLQVAMNCTTRQQLRFLDHSLRMHAASAAAPAGSAWVVLGRAVLLKTPDGSATLAAPVDYLSWTAEIAAFAQREDLLALHPRLAHTGRMTDLARSEFQRVGWTVLPAQP